FALPEMHLGRRGENDRIGAFDALGQVAGVMGNAVFLGDLRGGVLIAADQRGHLYAGNALERVEMLLAKGALAGYANLHRVPLLAIRYVGWRAAACLLLPADARLLLPAALRVP